MRILILVLCHDRPDYNKLESTIRETWGKSSGNVDVVYYKSDGFTDILDKTIDAFNTEYDYIFRTNLGSYIHKENLYNFLLDKPRENFYCGIQGTDTYYYGRPVRFVSGAGYILSKDIVKKVIENRNKVNPRCVDDVELGRILIEDFGIEPSPLAVRMNLCDDESYFEINDRRAKLSFTNHYKVYHYRLRSSDRNKDVEMMKRLHSMIG